jgi:hypothetical protein
MDDIAKRLKGSILVSGVQLPNVIVYEGLKSILVPNLVNF